MNHTMPAFPHPRSRLCFASLLAAGRTVTLMLAVALFTSLATAPAQAMAPVETFVQANIQKGLDILNNRKVSDAQRKQDFRNFLLSLTDMRRTALFTLGAARRSASPADLDGFVNAFRDYAIAVYEARLVGYSGQTLKVTGSTERAPGDYVVTTVLADSSGNSSDKQPIQVDFRIDKGDSKFVVLDASVVGVWLAIEERDQFTAFLAQHDDSVPALSAHLKELTAKLQSAGPAGRTKAN